MNFAERIYHWFSDRFTGRHSSAGLTAATAATAVDEALARRLEELRPVPALTTEALACARHTFLAQAARLRADSLTDARPSWPAAFRWTPLRPEWVGARAGLRLALTSAIALCAFAGVMAGVTLARVAPAAQASLPGDRLYAYKIGQEDLRAALTFNATSRVDLGLEFAGERAMELLALAQAGRPMPMETVTRMHQNLQIALMAASQLPDPQMQIALQKIQQVSQSTQATLERAEGSGQDVQSRAVLQWVKQVAAISQALVQQGLANPQAFRIQMGSEAAPATATLTPTPEWLNPTAVTATLTAINPPFIPTATPVSYPVAPTATRVPFNPTLAPVTPTATSLPFNPTPTPVPYVAPTSTKVPFNPTLAPVTPTATSLPFNPTPTPVPYVAPTSTNVPYNPTLAPVTPTATPVPYVAPTPTNVPYNPTLAPAAPTATPTP
jgi:hypothetical protein